LTTMDSKKCGRYPDTAKFVSVEEVSKHDY
jgi:hypothetical protein